MSLIDEYVCFKKTGGVYHTTRKIF